MFTYLDIPKLNSIQLEDAWSMIKTENEIPLPNFPLFSMYVIRDGELREFLYENFGKELKFRIQALDVGYQTIHTDPKRTFACNYLLDQGGDNVFTNFNKQKISTTNLY
jgi:hypothetical protein